jgi:hypothetical protein
MLEINEEELTKLQNASKELETLKAQKAEDDKKKQEEEDKKKKEKEENDSGLRDKARKEQEEKDQRAAEGKSIESAIKFNLSIQEFVTTNSDLLPSEIPNILSSAEKEKFDSASDKANAVKRGLIESFFAVQANVDLLTERQKAQVEDYLKLTKNGKEQKAASVFENIFEPTLESLRRVKKAEEVGLANSGYASGTKWEDDYKQRLIRNARKTHLGEKETK